MFVHTLVRVRFSKGTRILFDLLLVFVTTQDGSVGPHPSSCSTDTGSAPCSNSSLCACATLLSGGNVCTQQMNCDHGTPCLSNNTCEKERNHCVSDPRCPEKRICYAMMLFTEEVCPQLTN